MRAALPAAPVDRASTARAGSSRTPRFRISLN